ncbi:MAG: KAP family NTPase [Candidatus Thiodiazotropha lotti]|nr:KAP family NTPase [Candidatus Thiodiazotropha lotti]ODB94862.1 hypothetical protein A3197_19200 [Candidatus Thiodiazotropha endoloripes]
MDFTIDIKTPWEDPKDLLDRQQYSTILTSYLERINKPFVLNVNAGWGFGKTYFLRNWAESLKNHPVVYINAWENDFNDDPLITILDSLNNALSAHLNDNQEAERALKEILTAGGRFIKKTASILTKGAIQKALGTEAYEDLRQLNIDEFAGKSVKFLLEEHSENSKNIKHFRDELNTLLESIASNNNDITLPAFIFIDELDRCRPTYAIELLESIKHLFSVKGAVYIIATDSTQLQHSIRAVYGEGFNGVEYLRRFFDREFVLPDPSYKQIVASLSSDFTEYDKLLDTGFIPFHRNGREHTTDCENNCNAIDWWFDFYSGSFRIPTRTLIQYYEQFVLIINSTDKIWHLPFLLYLLFLYVSDRSLFDKFKMHAEAGQQLPAADFQVPISQETVRWLYHESQAPRIKSLDVYITASEIGQAYMQTLINNARRSMNPEEIIRHTHYGRSLEDLIKISIYNQVVPGVSNKEVKFLEYFSYIETAGCFQ